MKKHHVTIGILSALLVVVSSALTARVIYAANAPETPQEEAAQKIQDNLKESRAWCFDSVKECAIRFRELQDDTEAQIKKLGGPDGTLPEALSFGNIAPFPSR